MTKNTNFHEEEVELTFNRKDFLLLFKMPFGGRMKNENSLASWRRRLVIFSWPTSITH